MVNIIWTPGQLGIYAQKAETLLDKTLIDGAIDLTMHEFEMACQEAIRQTLASIRWTHYWRALHDASSLLLHEDEEQGQIVVLRQDDDVYVRLRHKGSDQLLLHVNRFQAYPNITSVGRLMVWTEEGILNEYWKGLAHRFWLLLFGDYNYDVFDQFDRAAIFSLLGLMSRKEYYAAFSFARYACESPRVREDERTYKRFLDFSQAIARFVGIRS